MIRILLNFSSRLNLAEKMLFGTVLVLFLLVLVFFVYVLLLRAYRRYRERDEQRKLARWEEAVLEFLAGAELDRRAFGVSFGDFRLFGEFIEEYLINIEGEDYERLIGMLQDIGLAPLLMKALRKSSKWDKAYAVHMLGLMRYKPAEEMISRLVRDDSPVVYINSFEALQRLESDRDLRRIVLAVLESVNINRVRISEILLGFGSQIDPVLIELLDEPGLDTQQRKILIDIIASRAPVEATGRILGIARSTSDREILISSIKAMGLIEDPRAAGFLVEQLDSDDWVVRSQAAKAVGKIGAVEALPRLEDMMLKDKIFLVKLYSALAIKRIADDWREIFGRLGGEGASRSTADILRYVVSEAD